MDYTVMHEKVTSSNRGKFWLDLYPITKLVMVLCTSALSICLPGYVFGFGLTLLFFCFCLACGKAKNYGRVMLSVLVVFVGLLVLARALFYGSGPVLATFGSFSIYQEGVFQGLRTGSLIMGFSSSIVFFFTTTDVEHLMLALETKNCPPKATFVILSTMQMIPQLSKNATVIQDAQRARGIETEGSLLVRAKAFIPMLLPLMLTSFSVAEEKALALETRGFSYPCDKTRLRVVLDNPAQKAVRWVMIAASVVGCVIGGYFKWLA